MTFINKYKTLEALLKAPVQRVAGEYTFARRKAATGELVQQVGPTKNLITDIGLNRLGTDICTYCFVGTGTATPNVANTTLQAEIARTPSTFGSPAISRAGASPYWVSRSVTWRFNAGEATGNLSEVGVGWLDGSDSRCFSRALIVDGGGSPVTLTVLADEVLDVTYTIKYYPPLDDYEQVLTISSVPYDLVTRAALCNDNNTAIDSGAQQFYSLSANMVGAESPSVVTLGSLTSNLQNAAYSEGALTTTNAYVNTSKTATGTFTCGLDVANFASGIQGFSTLTGVGTAGDLGLTYQQFQSTVTPPIPKDNTKVLTVGLSYSWDRYTP